METKSTIMERYDAKKGLYQNFGLEIQHQLENILREEGVVCNTISSRLKERESLSEKIDRKRDKYTQLEDITDITGVRIITYYVADVNRVAEIV